MEIFPLMICYSTVPSLERQLSEISDGHSFAVFERDDVSLFRYVYENVLYVLIFAELTH